MRFSVCIKGSQQTHTYMLKENGYSFIYSLRSNIVCCLIFTVPIKQTSYRYKGGKSLFKYHTAHLRFSPRKVTLKCNREAFWLLYENDSVQKWR